jgi:hypothetical protein
MAETIERALDELETKHKPQLVITADNASNNETN